MTNTEAEIIAELLEMATESRWTEYVRRLHEMGYTPVEIQSAYNKILKQASRELIELSAFEDPFVTEGNW